MIAKLLKLVKTYQSDIILTILVVLISVISFNLGRISVSKDSKVPVTITEPAGQTQEAAKIADNATPAGDQQVVASKNSKNKLYHFSWCSGASQIAEKNKITFPTEAAAIAAGYTLAGNCQK